MLSQGLLKEIRRFYNSYIGTASENECTEDVDYTKGSLQTIGVKEFIPYLEKYDEHEDERINAFLKSDKTAEDVSPAGLPVLQSCLETLRLVTKRYSKNQPKWITNRFLRSDNRHLPPIYKLSTSNPNNWNDDVYRKAVNVIESYIANRDADLKPLEQLDNPRKNLDPTATNVCDICNRHFVGEFQWQIHLRSNKHKKHAAKLKKQKQMEESVVTTPGN